MGASTSHGLSGSQFKKEAGEREITAGEETEAPSEGRSDVALKDHAADRIRSVYPDREPGEVMRLAETISNSSSLHETFFSSMSEDSAGDLSIAIVWRDIASAEDRETLAQAFDKFAPHFQYGPYCATVRVGNVYLLWDNSDLVIPSTEMSPIFGEFPAQEVDQPAVEATTEFSACRPLSLEDIQISTTFKEEFVLDMTQNKAEKVTALMDVLVRYNTKYHYGLLTCNCQHFISDVLDALEAKGQVHSYEDCLPHHSRVLEFRGLEVIKEEFNTHEELDTYVNIRLEDMDTGELYFCYGHYLLFHAWSLECPLLTAFKCCAVSCRFRELRYRV